jgi:hypothetical protein
LFVAIYQLGYGAIVRFYGIGILFSTSPYFLFISLFWFLSPMNLSALLVSISIFLIIGFRPPVSFDSIYITILFLWQDCIH